MHVFLCVPYITVLVWGNGRSGQLGLYEGVDNDFSLPVQLAPFCFDHVVKVVCGDELTLAITGVCISSCGVLQCVCVCVCVCVWVCVCVCACMCACVCERERERE